MMRCVSVSIANHCAQITATTGNNYLLVQRSLDRRQKFLANLGVFVLEACGELVQEMLRRQHPALHQLLQQQLCLLAHGIATIAQTIDDVRQNRRRVGIKIRPEAAYEFGKCFERSLCNLKLDKRERERKRRERVSESKWHRARRAAVKRVKNA